MESRSRGALQDMLRHAGATLQSRQQIVALLLIGASVAVAGIAFRLHANLSTAGSLELLIVLVVALRLGFLQATIVSVTAFLCLNFLFTEPVFTFSVADPQNWVSLFTFEATALLVSRLSSKVHLHAIHAEEQRTRAVKLYELSRAVLLIDRRGSTEQQLSALICEIFEVSEVHIWVVPESRRTPPEPSLTDDNQQARETYLEDRDQDDLAGGLSHRRLRLGASTIGAMVMQGWKVDPLTADAVASIAAITFERARAIQRENRAEIERDAERLRAAVLDGLAHGFKTPLTAIQTASSGLLVIDRLTPTQAELVSIIDERATMLGQLTTRLLQTAALEAREIHLRRTDTSISDLLHKLVREQDDETRGRISVNASTQLSIDRVDAAMIELALQQLIDNAAKYSAIGSAVEIAVSQTQLETSVLVQNRTKAGFSIKPEERTRIFERFYRGSETLYGPAGTGLGLSIAKKIAEAHGGGVSVESIDDRTSFTFTVQRYNKEKHG